MTYLDICVVSVLFAGLALVVARSIFVKPIFEVIDRSESGLAGLCAYLMRSGRGFYQAMYYLKREEVEIRENAIKRICDEIEVPKISKFLMLRKERERYDKFINALDCAREAAKMAECDYKRFGKAV